MNEHVDYSKLDPIKKCPSCGDELKKAIVNAPGGLYWDEKTRRVFGGAGEGLLDRDHAKFFLPFAPALRCEKCEIVIMDYSKRGGSGDNVDDASYEARSLQNVGIGP